MPKGKMRSKEDILGEMKIFPIPHDGVDITGIAEALLDIRDILKQQLIIEDELIKRRIK